MKNLSIIISIALLGYITYKAYPYVVYKYKMLTAKTKGINQKAPDAHALTLDGKDWSIKKQKGKSIILVFFSSYCPPCMAEIPKINKLYQKYKNSHNIEIISYSLDLSSDKDRLEKYIKDKNISYPTLLEKYQQNSKNNFAKKFEVFGAPSIWLIDKNQIIKASNRRSIEEIIPFLDKK